MVLAARGSRADETGVAPIQDPALAKALRRRALTLLLKSAAGAILLTALVWVMP